MAYIEALHFVDFAWQLFAMYHKIPAEIPALLEDIADPTPATHAIWTQLKAVDTVCPKTH